MKVVLFCGGYGMRMRNSSDDSAPKPMQMVGPRPLIWHLMRYYAHFGHKEFILCLGYGASHIKNYFLTYQEAASNDFVMSRGRVELMHSDISDWSITFVDTGLESAIGERLRRVRPHLAGDEYFLANYADVLTNAPLDHMIEKFHEFGAAASMIIVPPQSSFHCVEVKETGEVKDITAVSELPIWENGGYFVLSQDIFDYLPPGGDLVADVCGTLAGRGKLFGYRYEGFWRSADTFKERAELDARYEKGDRIYGDGTAVRDYVYVDDVVDAFMCAARLPLEAMGTYNIGTGEQTTVNEVYRRVAAAVGVSSPPRYAAARTGEVHAIALDSTEAREDLGWKPSIKLVDGIQRTIHWLRGGLETVPAALVDA